MKTSHIVVFLTAVFLSIIPLSAAASSVETGRIVSVPAAQTVSDNVYLAGGQVIFLGTATKDLTAAGGQVIVNGPVSGSVLLVGGTLEVLQPVKGSVRAAGGQITIGSDVSGDVMATGGSVTVLPGAVVGGDIITAGGAIDIEGTVSGSVRAYGGTITLNGPVAGFVSLHAGKQVTFGDKASVGGTLAYSAPQEASIAPGAKLGNQVTFTSTKEDSFSFPRASEAAGIFFGILGFLVLAKFIGILIAALILVTSFKTFSQGLVEKTLGHFWKKVGIGFIALVVVPAAAIILLVTLVGAYLAFMVGLAYALLLFAAGVYMCVFAGALFSRWIKKEASADWKWTILGTVAVFILALIPVVGWIANGLLFLAALGTIVMGAKRGLEAGM